MSAPVLDPAPHEFGGNLIFTEHELSPYFALDRRVKDGGGSASATVRHEGEVFDVTLFYQRSGLKPRDDPDFRLETVREFRIRLEARDGVGERKASYHVAPRWPNMESKGDAPDPSPPPGIVGVNVRCDGSNLPLDAYPALLRAAVDALDVNPAYFEETHHHANIFAFEQYVRVRRSKTAKVVGMNSPMQRIFEHVAGEGKFRELREDDRNGVEGYHHRLKMDSDGAAALVPGHKFGKKLKHYHPEHPRDDPDDPLYHPKVGVSLQSNLNGGSVEWSDRDALRRELDETLLNLLSWAGLPIRADPSVYVADAYFQVRESARPLALIDDPTPEIRREQNVLVSSLPVDPDLTASDRDVLKAVADGGRPVGEVEDETGWSKRTVYRVLDRLDDLLSLRDGTVGFASEYLGDAVRSALSDTLDALRRDTDGKDGSGAFAAWKRRYGVEVEDPADARLQLRFGRVPGDVNDALRDGLRAWLDSGRDPQRFKTGRARWQDSEGRSNYRVPVLG